MVPYRAVALCTFTMEQVQSCTIKENIINLFVALDLQVLEISLRRISVLVA